MSYIKSEEINYKKNFCEKYFTKGVWDLDVLKQVDILLKDKKGNSLLYIEAKYIIEHETQRRQALAQVILTNKKQDCILSKVAIIYQDTEHNDILEFIDCSDDSVMYNNDINWKAERPSSPTKDAIDRINDRIKNKITVFKNEEIKEFYTLLKTNQNIVINITENNFNVVYTLWKNEVKFKEKIDNEQYLINLFLVDVLKNQKYKKKYDGSLLSNVTGQDLIREGINLNHYKLIPNENEVTGIMYSDNSITRIYTIQDNEKYNFFWKKYKRPPEEREFLNILEHSNRLYSDKYRRDTGGEYTPNSFVDKQNEILAKNYNMDDFIVFDPCAGVGNLENQFNKDYKKEYCYLSTLEQMDLDTCKIKGFENRLLFDYLKDDSQPQFKYKGVFLDITEIAKRENRKLMVIMNPPYINKGTNIDTAIEFFNKVVKLNPDVIVYYCKTEFFFRNTISYFIKSNYKIKSHIFSNAKTTFKLSEWMISQVIFDKNSGNELNDSTVTVDRYELNKQTNYLEFIKTLNYDIKSPKTIKEIEKLINQNATGARLGQWTNDKYCIVVSNRTNNNTLITTNNLKYCLLLKGINFNTHGRYFEKSDFVYRGDVNKISSELFNDAIMFSLFYKGFNFTNKGQKNYIMPFKAEELGCTGNDLNALLPECTLFSNDEKPFDFREFLAQFEFSKEARDLYNSAFEIFRYYHQNDEYKNKDWNDSFYDITNTIMGKDTSSFKTLDREKDTRLTKVKTTKGAKPFRTSSIKYVVNSKYLPIFENFFNSRDILARKINKELVNDGILLWERENIY